MLLPESDLAYLAERQIPYELTLEGGMTCVLFPGWDLPPGYDRAQSNLLLRLAPGYPDVAPDMWWFDPPVRRADGTNLQGTESIEICLGRQFQRWSRHFPAGQWQSGTDGLESFLALVRGELRRGVLRPTG